MEPINNSLICKYFLIILKKVITVFTFVTCSNGIIFNHYAVPQIINLIPSKGPTRTSKVTENR